MNYGRTKRRRRNHRRTKWWKKLELKSKQHIEDKIGVGELIASAMEVDNFNDGGTNSGIIGGPHGG